MTKRSITMAIAVWMIVFCAFPALAGEGKLSVTYVKSPLNVPSILEKKFNLIEKAFPGWKISHPELTAGPKQTAGLASGSVDVANCLGGTSAILAYANGVDLKVVGIFARAPKAFTIMAKDKAITSIKDLKGKKVAGPKGTVLHQLLVAALKREGMTIKDVEFLGMGLADGVTAMLNGKVDACLAAGPSVPRSLEQGARILTNGEGLVEATTVIAVRGNLLAKHPDVVRRFMAVDAESRKIMEKDPEKALKATAEETGLSMADVKSMLPLYNFDSVIHPSDIEELKKTQDFLYDNGMLPKKIDIESMVQTSL